jgi:hypothetical protein
MVKTIEFRKPVECEDGSSIYVYMECWESKDDPKVLMLHKIYTKDKVNQTVIKELVVPDKYNDYTIESIDCSVFVLTRVDKLYRSASSVGERCCSCRIENLILSDGIKRICNDAFYSSDIDMVHWPASCNKIEHSMFRDSSIKSITNLEHIKSIGVQAFCGCAQLKDISELTDCESIESGAFQYCSSLERFVWPEKCSEIKLFCFQGTTNLKEFVFTNENAIYIGESAFKSSGLKVLDVSKSVACNAHKTLKEDIPKVIYPFYG